MRLRRLDLYSWVTVVMTVGAIVLVVPWLVDKIRHKPVWWDPVQHYIIHVGLKNTVEMAVFAVVGAALVGILLGTLLTVRWRPLQALIRVYVEIWRGLPIIVTLFIVYFALPSQLPSLSAQRAAVVALILWGSAQVAEATRGAVGSIPKEQHEAASALGFRWPGTMWFVILPQAFRRLLPPMIGLLVNVIQNTTIAALLGVPETLGTANQSFERLTISTGEVNAIAIFGFVMVIFFVISLPLTRLARFMERRLARQA